MSSGFLKKVCIIWKLREILDLMNFKKGAWRRAVQHLGERSGSELSAHAPVVQMLFDPVIPEKKTLTSGTDSGIITSNGIQTTSLSRHMKERSEERGVSLDDVKDALTNPLHIDEIKHDDQGRPSQRFIGEGATVNINPETGIITTVWKTGSGKIKKYKKR